MATYPKLRSIVLDCLDVREMADFYRAVLGWDYPEGFEPDETWASIIGPEGVRISFQRSDRIARTTWPDTEVPQQAHLDFLVDSRSELEEMHLRLLKLGAEVRSDQSEDPEEPLRVYVDPAGHLFCVFTHNP